MSAEQPARLAAHAGEALIAVMPTPAWHTLREQAIELLHDAGPALEGTLVPELDATARMLTSAAPAHAAPLRELLTARWTENLTRVLAADPAADEALRHLIERIGTAVQPAERPGKTMTNIARDRSTLFGDGS